MGGEQNRASDELEAGENRDAQRAREQGKYSGQRDDVGGQCGVAAHVIHVNTNLAALLNAQSVTVEFYARQAIEKKTITSSRTGLTENSEITNLSQHNVTVIHQEQRNEGTAYFVKYDLTVPEYSTDFSLLMMRSYQYSYQPVFVLRTKLHVEQASFPTLALEERDDSRAVNVVPTFALDNSSDQDWAHNTVLA
ncbi:MAG: hypothetical protein SLagBPW_42400 [Shewanella algae]